MGIFSKQLKPSQPDNGLYQIDSQLERFMDRPVFDHALISHPIEGATDAQFLDFIKKYGKEKAGDLLTKIPPLILLLIFCTALLLRLAPLHFGNSHIVCADGPPSLIALPSSAETDSNFSLIQHSNDMTSSYHIILPEQKTHIHTFNRVSTPIPIPIPPVLIDPTVWKMKNEDFDIAAIKPIDIATFGEAAVVCVYFSCHGTAENTTELNISKGDKILIASSGFIKTGIEAGLSGPEGIRPDTKNLNITQKNLLPQYNYGALLYRIGTQNAWKCYDPQNSAVFTSATEGPLEFTINDTNLSDNTGVYPIIVKIIKNKSTD